VRAPGGLERLRRAAPWGLTAAAAAVAAVWAWRGSFFGGDPAVQVWGFGPLAAGWAALLVLALPGGGPAALGRALSAPWLRALGRYSYGLYVLHYPIFLGLERTGLGPAVLAAALGSELLGIAAFAGLAGGATLAAALVSWRLLERPFLSLKGLVPYGRPAAGGPASPSPGGATPGPPTAGPLRAAP
jgi:peptidoglycan/LPS O-acetylase OafA/YrhL